MTQEDETQVVEEKLTRRRDDGWWRVGIGAILVAIGVDILIEQITGNDVDFVTLAIGLGLLAIWWKGLSNRGHGFLIAGSIVSGVGLGQLLDSLVPLDGMFQLGLAAGFAFLATRSHRAQWAWWPAAFLAAFGALGLASDVGTFFLIDRSVASIAAPGVAIALGVLLIMRPNIPKATFRTLVIVLIVVGIFMVASLPDRDTFNGFRAFGTNNWSRETRVVIPELDGRTLVVESEAGGVDLMQGPLGGTARTRRFGIIGRRSDDLSGSVVRIRETETEVILEPGSAGRNGYHLRLFAPPDTNLRIETGDGDVSINGNFGIVDIKTEAGDVSGQFPAQPDDRLSIETGAGDIELTVLGDPTVHARTAAGDLEVNDEDLEGFEREGTGGTVDLQTGAGDIQLRLTSATV